MISAVPFQLRRWIEGSSLSTFSDLRCGESCVIDRKMHPAALDTILVTFFCSCKARSTLGGSQLELLGLCVCSIQVFLRHCMLITLKGLRCGIRSQSAEFSQIALNNAGLTPSTDPMLLRYLKLHSSVLPSIAHLRLFGSRQAYNILDVSLLSYLSGQS